MAANTLIVPEKNNEAEGYEQPIDVVNDGIAAGGFYPQTASPGNLAVGMERDGGGNLVLKDGVTGSKTLAQLVAASGLTSSTHRALDQLVHDLAETVYIEVTRASGQVTDVIAWTNSGKTVKIRGVTITRTSGQVSSVVEKQYDAAGALLETLTSTITRASGHVASIAQVLT